MPRDHGDSELAEAIRSSLEDYVGQHVRPLMERIAAEVSERVFQEKFSQFPKGQGDVSAGARGNRMSPPLPETIPGSRKHKVPRGKLSGTVDAGLLKLFEEERRERGHNVSRMLDVVLWNYFCMTKPERLDLSFEGSEGSYDVE